MTRVELYHLQIVGVEVDIIKRGASWIILAWRWTQKLIPQPTYSF